MMEELKQLRELTRTLVAKDEVLAEQTSNWKYILNSVPELVFITNLDGSVTYVNHAMRNILSAENISSVADLPCFKKLMEGCMSTGPKSLGEVHLPVIGGWYEHTLSIIYDDAGSSIGYICMLKDITDRRHAQEELRKSEEKFRNVSQSAVDAIIIADGKGNIISWNRSAELMFGYTEEEIKGRPVVLIMPKKYRSHHLAALEKRVSSTDINNPPQNYLGRVIKVEGLSKSGEVFPIELVVSYWNTDEGMFFSGIIRCLKKEVRDISIEI
jgi:PAS domain S-box-containing protein